MADNQTKGTQLLGNIPFEALIGGPLMAAIKGQSQAAMITVHFLRSLIDNNDEVITVTFTYTRSNGTGLPQTVTITVPLLSLVPIPYLRIDEMDIRFKADINASTATTTKDDTAAAGGTSISGFDLPGTKFNMLAAYSSKTHSTATAKSRYSVEYTIDVYVKAVSDDIPAGMAKVLNILSNSIDVVDNG